MRFLALLLLFNTAYTKDFGTMGTTYPILEESLLKHLQDQINQKDPQQIQDQIKTRYTTLLQEPKPVLGVQLSDSYDIHYLDPTITVNQNIKDHEGNIIVKKGTKFNPLTIYRMEQNLLFFDGNDQCQIDWAKNQQGVWILTSGKPLELEEKEKQPVYFDQGGKLTSKFEITKVPSKVSQEGKCLKIESFPIGGKK